MPLVLLEGCFELVSFFWSFDQRRGEGGERAKFCQLIQRIVRIYFKSFPDIVLRLFGKGEKEARVFAGKLRGGEVLVWESKGWIRSEFKVFYKDY